ncbi:membrane protein [Polynucleobacter sp. TUM22923]|nr:membrane protein [Polynucleobacter sp. TUM22923]
MRNPLTNELTNALTNQPSNQPPNQLPASHLLLALGIVAVWGTNFVVIKNCLAAFPPFYFAALRYLFALLPLVFFLPKPKVSWANLCIYGLATGVGQFGVMYYAIHSDISPGLASLVIQTQVFFTIGFAMFFAQEGLKRYQAVAVGVSFIGLVIIAMHTDATTTFLGLALVVFAGLSWGIANTVSRKAGSINMLAYVVWASAFSIPPLVLIALMFEGGAGHLWEVTLAASWGAWVGVLWQSWGNTLFGYAAWGWLLSKHPAALVAPAPLLVPIFGMGASAFFLGEALPGWKLMAAGLVIAGLIVNLFWPVLEARFRQRF